jgi:hypothetical protein
MSHAAVQHTTRNRQHAGLLLSRAPFLLHRCAVAPLRCCIIALLQRIAELSAAARVRAYVYVYAHFDRQCEVSLEVGSTAPNRTTRGTPNPAQSDATDDPIRPVGRWSAKAPVICRFGC